MVHLYTLLLIVNQNILTLICHTIVHLWVLDTLLEHLTPLGLVDSLKYRTKTLVHIFVCFYKTLPKIGHAFAHNPQPLSALNVSPQELVFHIRPRSPLTFDLNLNRNKNNTCISQYCSQLPEQFHYDKTDLNPFFLQNTLKIYSTMVPCS